MTLPLISFIIPHKGRESLLMETLNSIAIQEFNLDQVDVLLISQNESIGSSIQQYKDKINLKIFHRPVNVTISALRNFGASQTTAEYLAFLDADIFLSKNWIKTMLDVLSTHKGCVIASAVQRNSENAPPLEKIRTALSNPIIDQAVHFLPGRNLFLHRSTFTQIGGFPENLVTCEDYYFTNQADKIGELFYTSAASYIHLGEDKNFGGMFKKEIWRGQSNLLSISGRRIPINEIPSFIMPVGLVGILILSIVALLAGLKALALGSLILFIIPLSVYTLRLHFLTRDHKVPFAYALKFYLFYFPARAIGTIVGVFKAFKP
jgi:GT2 family glycosyltransferase